MSDTLNKLAQVKADLKSALANCHIEAGDIFSDYPAMIKSLGIVNDELFDSFFELMEDDYIIEEAGDYNIYYYKYKYRFGDDYIRGAEHHRAEAGTLVLDVETIDGSEITFDSDSKTYTTKNGKLYMKEPDNGDMGFGWQFKKVANWINKVKKVNYMDLGWLPGNGSGLSFTNEYGYNDTLKEAHIKISSVNDLSYFFDGCKQLVTLEIDLNGLDTVLLNYTVWRCIRLKDFTFTNGKITGNIDLRYCDLEIDILRGIVFDHMYRNYNNEYDLTLSYYSYDLLESDEVNKSLFNSMLKLNHYNLVRGYADPELGLN